MLCSSPASVRKAPMLQTAKTKAFKRAKIRLINIVQVSSHEMLYESFSFALPFYCSLPLYSACVNVNDQNNSMLPGQSLAMGLNSNHRILQVTLPLEVCKSVH